MANPRNAHIRRGAKAAESPKQESPDLRTADAQRLLDDPAFRDGVTKVRNGLIHSLESLVIDGRPETDEIEREICRQIRGLKGIVKAISNTVQTGKFKLSVVTEQEEET